MLQSISSLVSLKIEDCGLDNKGLNSISQGLRENFVLQNLELAKNKFGADALNNLLNSLSQSNRIGQLKLEDVILN